MINLDYMYLAALRNYIGAHSKSDTALLYSFQSVLAVKAT